MMRDYEELRILKEEGFYGVIPPVMCIVRGTDAQASANFSTPFFTAERDYQVLSVKERHEVAATDGSVDILKVPDGTAPSSGTSLLSSAMVLTGTADTLQSAVMGSDTFLARGQSLTAIATGLLTNLRGETIIVRLKAI